MSTHAFAEVANGSAETVSTIEPVPTSDPVSLDPSEPTVAVFSNPADWFVPPYPKRLADLDVSASFLADLALKTVSLDADPTASSIATRMHVPMMVAEELL